jgi:predicted transcriptional regulator
MEKFVPIKTNNEKIVISIRIDIDTLNKVDTEASKIDISRNELINQCIDFALNNLDNKESIQK